MPLRSQDGVPCPPGGAQWPPPDASRAFQSRRAVAAAGQSRVARGTEAAGRRPRRAPPGFSADTFSRQGLISGATATEAGCRALPDGLWVGTGEGRRECLRHAAAGMEGAAGRTALVYVPGDPEGASYRSAGGRPQVDGVSEHYETSPETRRAAAEALSAATGGRPVVLLARPGMHGSSGDHARDRHTPDEVELIDDALTQLRRRYGFQDLALVGFSSGGAVVANLLARRSDVRCAAMASAPLDMAAFYRRQDGAVPDHYAMRGDMADPMRTVSAIRPGAAVFVLGDRRDRSVPASAWEAWVAAARRAGLRVHAAEVDGLDRPELGGGESRHLTTARGMEVAQACAEGAPAGADPAGAAVGRAAPRAARPAARRRRDQGRRRRPVAARQRMASQGRHLELLGRGRRAVLPRPAARGAAHRGAALAGGGGPALHHAPRLRRGALGRARPPPRQGRAARASRSPCSRRGRAPRSAAAAAPAPAPAPAVAGAVRLLVGFGLGSNTDWIARVAAEALRERLGRPVVVENLPGRAGANAAEAVARAAPDGATLGLFSPSLATARHASPAAWPSTRWPTSPRSASSPPRRTWSSSRRATRRATSAAWPRRCGPRRTRPAPRRTEGSFLHLTAALLVQALGAACRAVHYADPTRALADLAAGRVQLYANNALTGLPAAREGRARALAVTSRERLAAAAPERAMREPE